MGFAASRQRLSNDAAAVGITRDKIGEINAASLARMVLIAFQLVVVRVR